MYPFIHNGQICSLVQFVLDQSNPYQGYSFGVYDCDKNLVGSLDMQKDVEYAGEASPLRIVVDGVIGDSIWITILGAAVAGDSGDAVYYLSTFFESIICDGLGW